jgi:CHRD domain
MKRKLWLPILMIWLVPCLAWAAAPKTFMAHLTGAEETPGVETAAMGHVRFDLSQDGKSLHYKLMVQNLQDITMAHIHLGPAGKEGPVAVWLYPATPPPALKPGKFSGVLAEGDITAANLAGPLKGKPLSALVQDIQKGQAYVNVHTKEHPGGELRGQLK